MIFQTLIQKLAHNYEIKVCSCNNQNEIKDVAFIDGTHSLRSQDTIYFGYDNQLQNLDVLPTHCILASSNPLSFPAISNLAMISGKNLFTIFNDTKLYLSSASSNGIFEELSSVADQTHSIESVIDAASIHLGNSLIFCDRNFKIIASSNTYPVTDSLWLENIKQGYCSYDFIQEVKELEPIKNASLTTSCVEVTCPLSPLRKLSCKVFHNQTQVGFLLMLESENQILSSHFDMLSRISHVISYTIAFYLPDLFERKNIYHEVLYDMLIGAPMQEISLRLKTLHFPEHMQVLFLRSKQNMDHQKMKDSIVLIFKNTFSDSHITFVDKGVVVLITYPSDASSQSILLKKYRSLSEEHDFYIGVSNAFDSIESFVTYYHQAHSALTLGMKLGSDSRLFLYETYEVFDLFTQINNSSLLKKYIHPALPILQKTDLENHSDLYKTLFLYVEHGCSIKLTSEALFIHRNSLVYRLNRIEELCHINYSDIQTLFLLRLSFLIDCFINEKRFYTSLEV